MGPQTKRVCVYLAQIIALAAVYFCLGKLGLKLAFLHESATAVWPPTGVALAVGLLFGHRLWPGVWLGAFLLNLTTHGDVVSSIGMAHGNTLEAVVGVWLVQRFARGRHVFDRAGDIFRFVLLAAILSPVVSATFGVTSLAARGLASWDSYFPIWVTWWLGDMVSAIILTPLLVIWTTAPFPRWTRAQFAEAGLVLCSVLLAGGIVFGSLLPPFSHFAQAFACIPPLLWAAFRFGQGGAVSGAFALAGVAIWGTLRGFGPFGSPDPNESLLILQAFLGTLTVTGLALGAVGSERHRAEEQLRLLSTAVEAAVNGVAITDRRGTLQWVNPAFAKLTGYNREEVVGQNPRVLKSGRHPPEFYRQLWETILRGEPWRGQLVNRRKDGTLYHEEMTITPVRAAGGEITHFVAIKEDVTERLRAEAALRASEDRLEHLNEELEARVSERTTELVAAHRQLQAQVTERRRLEAEIANTIEREQQRLGRELHEELGQQLVAISLQMAVLQTKLEKVSPTRSREAKRLQNMLRQCVEQTRRLARGFYPVELEQHGLLMALHEITSATGRLSDIACVVESDGHPACETLTGPLAIQLFRVAQEAVHNAVHHAHARHILIRLASVNGYITLTVKDDGVGLPPNLEQTPGMGLRIMQHRAHLVSGELDYRNHPDGGAIVTCSVPAAE